MSRYFSIICLTVCLLIMSVATKVIAADVSAGLGGSWMSSPYKEHDGMMLPVPLLHFEGERFYARGLDAGVHIWRNKNQAISLGASYFALAFDPGKTDDHRLKRLNDRYSTLNTYVQYALQSDCGHTGLRILRDVLGNSDAFSAEAYYKYPFMLGPVYLIPGAGLRWDSKEHLDYYFGVSGRESRKSGLDEYTPDSGVSPFLSLEADWRFAENWSVMAAGQVLFLSKNIKDSPMVDDSQVFTMTIGLKYAF